MNASHSSLLAQLYSGVTDRQQLREFLDSIASAAGCCAAELCIGVPRSGPGAVHVFHGISDATMDDYYEYYCHRDPLLSLAQSSIGQVTHERFSAAADVVDMREFAKTEICSDWYSNIGERGAWHNCLATFHGNSTSGFLGLGLYRDRKLGAFTPDGLSRLDPVLPDVGRALHILETLEATKRQLDAARSVIDRVPVGVLVCRADAGVDWMNRVARRIVRGESGPVVRDGRLFAPTRAQTVELHAALARAATDDAPSVRGFTIPGAAGTRALCLAVLPAHQAVDWLDGAGRRAMVFVSDARPQELSGPILEGLFGFTPAEARVVGLLVTGQTTGQAAQTLAVSKETVRSHLKSAYAKTETSGQADLVGHVAHHLGWLAHPSSDDEI